MSARIVSIPIPDISAIRIFDNAGRKTLAAVKAETGADYILNGGFFSLSTFAPVGHLRIDGVTKSGDVYDALGIGWDGPDSVRAEYSNKKELRNFIGGVALARGGLPAKLYYAAELGGTRGRSAVGIGGGKLILYCVGDGDAQRCTPETLQKRMLALGAEDAIMLDGGSSSQCDFRGETVTGQRVVRNLICVHVRASTPNTPGAESQPKDTGKLVYLDPGHGGTDTSNGSPDGSYKEHEFALDIGRRIQAHLQQQGVHAELTRADNRSVSLSDRTAMANRAKADLFVSLHSNAVSGGWGAPSGLCVYTFAEGGVRDELANNILDAMRQSGVKIFGSALYHANYAVLRLTNMPAALIEYGFHTNGNDVTLLKSSGYRDKLAEATAVGICKTLGLVYNPPESNPPQTTAEYIVVGTTADLAAAEKAVKALTEIGLAARLENK